MKIKHKLLLISFLLFQSILTAHNPQQSSFKLIISEPVSFLTISLSQYGVEQALIKKHPDLDISTIEIKKLKELLVKHLKENIKLFANNEQLVQIGKGVIKLGSHQTDLKFQLTNFPEELKYLEVNAPCFQENEKQNNFFTVVYKGLNTRAKLSRENNFTSQFIFNENEISVNSKNSLKSSNNHIIWIAIIFLSLVFLVLLAIKFRKN